MIELKTIRTENKPKPQEGVSMGAPLIPNWWGNMFENNVITKIEDKKRRVLKQLQISQEHFNADLVVLAIYNRRIGPSTLMESGDYLQEMEYVKEKYPEIDVLMVMDYFGKVLFYPSLPISI